MSFGFRQILPCHKARVGLFSVRSPIFKKAVDVLIYPVAILAPIALLPQVVQLYSTQDASSLSLPTWAVLGFLNIVWLCYGLVHKEKPILMTNAFLAVLNFAIAIGILLFS